MAIVDTYGLVGPLQMRPPLPDFSSGLNGLGPVDNSPPVLPYLLEVFDGPLTDNTPVSELGLSVVSYHSPSFLDDYYYRVHVNPARVDLGNLLSSQTRDVEVWNAHLVGKLLSSVDETALDGITLAEPDPAPTTFGALESRVYQLSISTSGSPVIDGYYTFVFPAEAPTLRVTGRRVVIWPFVPQTKFRESLQWMTDVLQAYSAEQRLALRQAPRQVLTYDFQLTPYQYSRAKAIATQWAHRVYGAPVWAEAVRLGPLSSGISTLNFDTTNADFRANDIVLLWDDDESFSAVETLGLTPTSLELKLPLAVSYSNAYVMPLRFARTLQGAEFRRDAHDIVLGRMSFLVTNNVDLGASIGLPQYRGRDVMTDRSVVLSDMSEKIVRELDVFDNGSGPVEVDPVTAYPTRTESMSMTALTRAEAWRMRKWLHARRGKQKSFWLPSWNADLVILANVGSSDTSIVVRPIGYPLYYSETDIMVLLNSGAMLFGHVTSGATDPGGNEVLALSASLGTAFAASDVALACFMKHVRLDTDQAELSHTYGGYVSTAVAVIEVPEGNP